MLTLVCAATSTEARASRRGLRDSTSFEILETGMGHARAAKALRERLARAPRPDEIISTGFAGSRVERLRVGAWIVAQKIISRNDTLFALEPATWEGRLNRAGLTYDRVVIESVSTVAGKSFAGTIADAVDMESAALAQVASEKQISFHVFRLISDTPAEPIPDPIIELSTGSKVRGFASLLMRPSETAHFIRRMLPLTAELTRVWKQIASA